MKRQNAEDWTDAAESDPGIMLLELFAYLAEARLRTRRRYLLTLAVALAFVCRRRRTAKGIRRSRCCG
jgi:hypothetical protein